MTLPNAYNLNSIIYFHILKCQQFYSIPNLYNSTGKSFSSSNFGFKFLKSTYNVIKTFNVLCQSFRYFPMRMWHKYVHDYSCKLSCHKSFIGLKHDFFGPKWYFMTSWRHITWCHTTTVPPDDLSGASAVRRFLLL